MAMGLAYLAVVLIGFTAYVTEILPLARGLYDHADLDMFIRILAGDQVPALLVVLSAGVAVAAARRDGTLAALSLGLLGAILAGVSQGKGWDYHFVCARGFALVLAVLAAARLFGAAAVPRGLTFAITALALAGSGALSPPFKAQREFQASPTGRLGPLLEQYAPGKPVLWLSGAIYPQYPALPYNGSRSAMTYMSLWMLPALYGAGEPVNAPSAMGAYEKRLFDDVGTSLERVKPPLVIVADPDSEGGFQKPGFDYLAYFQRHPAFAAAWTQYRAVARVDRLTLYERLAQ
jgi:hypothetical protein